VIALFVPGRHGSSPKDLSAHQMVWVCIEAGKMMPGSCHLTQNHAITAEGRAMYSGSHHEH
jgi:hypothetical protein